MIPTHSRPDKVKTPRRKVTGHAIQCFLLEAIQAARKAGTDSDAHDFKILTAGMSQGGTVRLDLDNGDIVFLELEHLVPRD
ncbi:hypothetical protein [Bradyrhizobium elkanii]|uniref:hypothetical protein n=1 Tax=Bradyrhizobium elkanii TaxID=29448 RepID=UPI00272D45F8|nr:hypothetical protein [Bradyrhizobium elkanii]WLA80313.1 hypothetical protein QNJ99_33750 [Bradyrhizobium elkanii]